MTKAKSPVHRVSFRRRREGRTDYSKRLALIKSGKVRMVVRRSNKNIMVQFVKFEPAGDKTLLTVCGPTMVKKFNWPAKRNVWTAYLTGLYAGKEASKAGVKEFILDVGRYTASKGAVIFAALKGAVDSGLSTSYNEEKVPVAKIKSPPDSIKASFEEAIKKIKGPSVPKEQEALRPEGAR